MSTSRTTRAPRAANPVSRRAVLQASLLGATGLLGGCSTFAAGVAGTPVAPGTVTTGTSSAAATACACRDGDVPQEPPEDGVAGGHAHLGQPLLHQARPSTIGDQAAQRRGVAPDPDEDVQQADLLQELTPTTSPGTACRPTSSTPGLQAGLVDGKIYAIPIDTHPLVLFYNTKICGEAGLLDSDGKLKPLEGREVRRRAGEGEAGHRAVRRHARHQRRYRLPVALLPDVVRAAGRRGTRRQRHEDRARRRQGQAGPHLHADLSVEKKLHARRRRLLRARSRCSSTGRPASTSTASGRSPRCRPPSCRSA